MAPPPDLVVLLASLRTGPTTSSVLELLRWLGEHRPELAVRVVSASGGGEPGTLAGSTDVVVLDERPAASVARGLLRASQSRPAGLVRSTDTRRVLRTGAVPVLVDIAAGRLLNWLDPEAGPVVAVAHPSGTAWSDLDEQDRIGIERRAAARVDDLHLQPTDGLDASPGLSARLRLALAERLGLDPDAPLVLLSGLPGEPIPPDPVLGAVWTLVERHPGLHAIWSLPHADLAESSVSRHLADAGLAGVVHLAPASPTTWQTVAAVDAVVAATDPDPAGVAALSAALAPERTTSWGPDDPVGPATVDLVTAVLPGGASWLASPERWLAAVEGPRLLSRLGLDARA